MKVLVVEDDRLTREGLVETLTHEGYEVDQAEVGQAALVRFAEDRPDFVCLDVMMPNLSGYEVCRHIRRA